MDLDYLTSLPEEEFLALEQEAMQAYGQEEPGVATREPTYLRQAAPDITDETMSSAGGFTDRIIQHGKEGIRSLPVVGDWMKDMEFLQDSPESRMRTTAGLVRFTGEGSLNLRAQMYRKQGYTAKVEFDPTSNEETLKIWHPDRHGWIEEGSFADNPLSTGSIIANLGEVATGASLTSGPLARLGAGAGLTAAEEGVKQGLLGGDSEEGINWGKAGTNVASTVAAPYVAKGIEEVAKAAGTGVKAGYKYMTGKGKDLYQKGGKILSGEYPAWATEMAAKTGVSLPDILARNKLSPNKYVDQATATKEIRDVIGINARYKTAELADNLRQVATLAPEEMAEFGKSPTIRQKFEVLDSLLNKEGTKMREFYTANDIPLRGGEFLDDVAIDRLTANNFKRRVQLTGKREALAKNEQDTIKRNTDNIVKGFLENAIERRVGGVVDESPETVIQYASEWVRILNKAVPAPEKTASVPTVQFGERGAVKSTNKALKPPKTALASRDAFDSWVASIDVDPRMLLKAVKDEEFRLADAVNFRQMIDRFSVHDKEVSQMGKLVIRDGSNQVRENIHAIIKRELPDQYDDFARSNNLVHNLIDLVEEVGAKSDQILGKPPQPGGYLGSTIASVPRRVWQMANTLRDKPEVGALIQIAQEKAKEAVFGKDQAAKLPQMMADMAKRGIPTWEAVKSLSNIGTEKLGKTYAGLYELYPGEEKKWEIFPRQASQVTEDYILELGDRLLPGGEPADEQQTGDYLLLQELTEAFQLDDFDNVRTIMEDISGRHPELFEDGVGFDGKISSPAAQKTYLDGLKKKAVEGDSTAKLEYYKQMSAFNAGDSRLVSGLSQGKRRARVKKNAPPKRGERRQYPY